MNISQNILHIRNQIIEAELLHHRKPGSVLLLAVSKQQGPETILEAYRQGIHDFAENYYQEALEKMSRLEEFPICWHFIGPLQSNKAKGIAANFSWVHSVSRYKIAQVLNQYRPSNLDPLNICIQVNLIPENTKSGIPVMQVETLAQEVAQLPNLRLRGLMTIPPPLKDPILQYSVFIQLKELMDSINKRFGLHMDTLSMGMSEDMIPAIQAGSTIVRIGRAIFGERSGKPT